MDKLFESVMRVMGGEDRGKDERFEEKEKFPEGEGGDEVRRKGDRWCRREGGGGCKGPLDDMVECLEIVRLGGGVERVPKRGTEGWRGHGEVVKGGERGDPGVGVRMTESVKDKLKISKGT